MADHRIPFDHEVRGHRASLGGGGSGDTLGELTDEVRVVVAHVVP
jgi:hypothetical protein